MKHYLGVLDQFLFPKDLKNNLWRTFRNNDWLVWYRLGCFIYLTGIYIWALVMMPNAIDNFIYLTMQGYFLTWVFFALALEDYVTRKVVKQEVVPGLWKFTYLVYEIALAVEVPITIVFWTILMAIVVDLPGVDANIIAVNVNLHAGPFLCLFFDLLLNGIQFPKQHFYVTLVFGIFYMLINLFWTIFEHVIYRPINWVTIVSYVLVVCCFLFTFVTHYLCGLYYEKVKKDKLQGEESKGILDTQSYMHDQL